MDFKDYYATLGLTKSASEKEIKQAYRKLARKHHPDVNPGDKAAETRFKEINEAYEVLGDPEKRKKYDELGANWRQYEQAQQQGYPPGWGPGAGGPPGGSWSYSTGGPGGGFRTMTEDEMREMFGDEDPFSDFFRTFFGGGGAEPGRRTTRGSRTRARKGHDVEQEIDLTLEQAFTGVTQRLSIKHAGHTRTVDVRIPPGVRDGSRVRVAGEGERGSEGAAAGDLYLKVRLRPHSRFERKGQDLYTHVAVPVTTAVLGGEAEVPTLLGRPLRLKIPPNTQAGQVFRLKGQGMPAIGKPDDRGDLYATLDLELPRSLTAEQRRHYEALQKLEDGTKNSAA
jgi:DnaJ-class molecular chaperone